MIYSLRIAKAGLGADLYSPAVRLRPPIPELVTFLFVFGPFLYPASFCCYTWNGSIPGVFFPLPLKMSIIFLFNIIDNFLKDVLHFLPAGFVQGLVQLI